MTSKDVIEGMFTHIAHVENRKGWDKYMCSLAINCIRERAVGKSFRQYNAMKQALGDELTRLNTEWLQAHTGETPTGHDPVYPIECAYQYYRSKNEYRSIPELRQGLYVYWVENINYQMYEAYYDCNIYV